MSDSAAHETVDANDPVAVFLGRPPPPAGASADYAIPRERSIAGLYVLAIEYAWGGVLELATSLLTDDDDAAEAGYRATVEMIPATVAGRAPNQLLLPHERLLIEAYRALALVQTRRLDRAATALEALGPIDESNPKYCYESYPESYPDHPPGSFVPFELTSLSIEVRVRKGDSAAISDCYALRERWPDRAVFLTSALIGYHLRAHQLDTAVDLTRDLALSMGSTARALYMYARVLLHVGDFQEARRNLARADSRRDSSDEMRHSHRALLLAAEGDYEPALVENDRVASLESASGEASLPHVRAYANCNAGICLMQLGRLKQGMERLENCLREDPEPALDEGLVFNLCTMYDLAYPDESGEKKKVLHRLASRYGRQGFNLDMSVGT